MRQLITAGNISEEELAYYQTTYQQSTLLSQPVPSDRLRSRGLRHDSRRIGQPRSLFFFVGRVAARRWTQRLSLTQLAGATLLLFVGACLGFWLRPTQVYETQLSSLTSEVQHMREMMVLTLLEQPSATQRLKAVSISTKLSYTDETIYQALLKDAQP